MKAFFKGFKVILLVLSFHVTAAASIDRAICSERETASSKEAVCKHADGYGSYSGKGATIHIARAEATKQCFNRRLDIYAANHGGNMPDDEQAGLMMDDCVNICD